MKNGCIADNLPEPDFEITPTMFSICFHIRHIQKDTIKDGINSIQQEILDVIQKTPEITAETLSEILKINIRNTEKNLKYLKDSGYIERIGARKNGYWQIIKL